MHVKDLCMSMWEKKYISALNVHAATAELFFSKLRLKYQYNKSM